VAIKNKQVFINQDALKKNIITSIDRSGLALEDKGLLAMIIYSGEEESRAHRDFARNYFDPSRAKEKRDMEEMAQLTDLTTPRKINVRPSGFQSEVPQSHATFSGPVVGGSNKASAAAFGQLRESPISAAASPQSPITPALPTQEEGQERSRSSSRFRRSALSMLDASSNIVRSLVALFFRGRGRARIADENTPRAANRYESQSDFVAADDLPEVSFESLRSPSAHTSPLGSARSNSAAQGGWDLGN
jgi:hypothetical protein